MRLDPLPRASVLAAPVAVALALALAGCGGGAATSPAPRGTGAPAEAAKPAEAGEAPSPPALANAIPPEHFDAVLKAHQKGVGHMERYVEYPQAVAAFREVRKLAPGWIPGSINLAIALLNSSGVAAEEAKKGNGEPAPSNFDEALMLLDEVLRREPENLHAHYCRGIILEYVGHLDDAHKAFAEVNTRDPRDGHTWYKLASTVTGTGKEALEEQIRGLTKALECNPYLVPALYKLQLASARNKQPERQKELLAMWRQLNPKQNAAAPGDPAETVYGEMGRYARLIDINPEPKLADAPSNPPRFDVPARLQVALPEGHRWARPSDFSGPNALLGRARSRFGATVATFDADADGKPDVFLAAAVAGPEGVRDVLLKNEGDGRFTDVSAAWKLPAHATLGAAAGDFDADGKIDLFLAGAGDNRLLRNAGGHFEDVTETAGLPKSDAISLTARWLDLDQDGDLDLYVVNHAPAASADAAFGETPPPGAANVAFRNDGKPAAIPGRPADNWAPSGVAPSDLGATAGLSLAFTPWPTEGAEALGGGVAPHTGVAALDADADRDLDLVLASETGTTLVLNDRLGRFRAVPADDLKAPAPLLGLQVIDLDRDGRSDLAAIPARGKVALWRNRPAPPDATVPVAWEFWNTDAHDWRSATTADLDLDGGPDLVGLPAGEPAPEWARHAGNRLQAAPLALGPDATAALSGLALADLAGDPLPDLLLVRDDEGPFLARNLGNGNRWLAMDLSGRWKASFDRMRTNPHGLGAKVLVQGQGLNVPWEHTTPASGLGQSVGPIVLGLGRASEAALVRLTWPDGVMQCELNKAADQRLALAENNRKTGSCPVLFTWNGERFTCIGDFLGGGGLGYMVAPGVYSQPDRDEAVAIAADQLRPVDGAFRLSITEPMDEVAYLDHLVLEVVDRPPGVDAAPEERFAPGGNRPSGKLVAWRDRVDPAKATDHAGRDVTETLRAWDRRTADGFKRLGAWIGYTEPHAVVLDFGDRLAKFGPGDRLALVLAGWVEYPYSQTNYAAATAGVELQTPILERQKPDGSWEVLESDPGYPAGLPRRMLLDLTGKLSGESCVLRIRTNMECYWDEAFVAVAGQEGALQTTTLPVSKAVLGHRGYTREVSPDGRLPLLYDYDYIDPAPLAQMRGRLTRHGDVAELLRADDDQLCLVGPGEEVQVEFDARSLPPLPEGWTRSYVLRSFGYCKDADPLTAGSDTVGPLPWKGMPAFPFGPEGERPRDAAYQAYLDTYQTRAVGEPSGE
jgi:tetratricopeptide (TPR) repeat protein